ncbi:LPD38 domain-containing protein [Marinicauda pacifica]|uniref:LPD38 domain-containing protein n=1 Tax=Marinicauda pacifica TaxID=1133559 RepID=UPI0035C7DAC9
MNTVSALALEALPFSGGRRTRLDPGEQAAWLDDAEQRRSASLARTDQQVRAVEDLNPVEFRRVTGLYPEQFEAMSPQDRQAVENRIRQERERADAQRSRSQANVDQVEAMRRGDVEPARFGPIQSAGGGALQSLASTLVSAPLKAAGAVQSTISGGEPEDTRLYRAGESVSAFARNRFPDDEARSDEFGQQLAEGAGSAAGFAGGGLGARALGITGKGATALVGVQGAAAQGASGLDEAIAAGADRNTKLQAFYANAGLGATEAVPFSRFLGRLDNVSGGGVSRVLANTGAQSLDEFMQEVTQTVGSNVIAAEVAGYDPERGITEGAGRAGLIGAILGAAGGAATAVNAPSRQSPLPDFSAGGTPVSGGPNTTNDNIGPRMGEPATMAERAADQAEADLYTPEIEAMVQEVRRARGPKPQAGPTLAQFVRSQGGVSDDRGDVAAAAGNAQRAGAIVSPQGRQIDDLAQSAFEAGYFPDFNERPDRARFIEYLSDDLSGRPVLPVDRIEAAEERSQGENLARLFESEGIDVGERDETALRRQLASLARNPEGQPRTGDDIQRERRDMQRAGYFAAAPQGARGPDFSAGGIRVSAPSQAASQSLPDFAAGGVRVSAPAGAASRSLPDFSSGGTLQSTGRVASLEGVRQRDEAGIPAREGESQPARTLREIASQFNRDLGLTNRQGRLRSPKALGEYDQTSGVLRTRTPEEMDVLSHEGGHALAFRYRDAFDALERAVPSQLKALAYRGADPGALADEGFAEFFRLYTTNREYARQNHPEVFEAFERTFRAAAPQEMQAVDRVMAAYDEFLQQPSGDSITADIVSSGGKGGKIGQAFRGMRENFGGSVLSAADRLYTAFLDDLHPINRAIKDLTRTAERNTGSRVELPAASNAYTLSRLARDAYGSGHMDLMHGVRSYRSLDPEGPGLADALGVALGDRGLRRWDQKKIDTLGSYLVSRRAVQEWRNYERGRIPNPPDKFTRADHEQNIAEIEAANPQFQQAASMLYEWNNRLWKKKFDAGLITEEQYEGGIQDHPDYVPFIRDMGEDTGRPTGSTGNNKGATFQAFRGSRRAIINPIESMMRDAYQTSAVISRNDAIRALHDLSRMAGPGGGAIVEEIPATETRAISVDVGEAFRDAAKAQGLNERDIATIADAMDHALDGQMSATLFSGGVINERGEPIVFVWRNGKRHALRLADGAYGRDLFSALTGLGAEQENLFTKILAVPTQALRMGIVSHPEFFLTNFIRDQVSAWVLTDVGFKPFASGAVGTAQEIGQTDWARRYNAFGGIMGGANVSSMDQSRAESDIQALRKKGYAIRRFASWRGFGELTEIPETGTRLGLFRLAFNRAKGQGLGDYEAAIEAAYTARDYIDFGRHGSRMLTARRLVPFFNAALQGLDKSTRVLSGGESLRRTLAPLFSREALGPSEADRARTALAVKAWGRIAALGVLGVSITALYADDPEYREINDYLRGTHWLLKLEGEWVAIPKPFELAILSNVFERAYEGTVKQDPQAGERLVRSLAMTVVPPHEIPAISVPAGIAANRDFFTGAPIVPEHLQGLEPHLQFNAYTSEFGKRVGEAVGVSPSVIDHAITGFGGSWGRTLLEMSNRLQPGRAEMSAPDTPIVGRFVRDPSRGANSSTDFWEQVGRDGGELHRAQTTFQHYVRAGMLDQAAEYLEQQSPPARDWTVINTFMDPNLKRLHPMRRAQDAIGVLSGMRREINQGSLEVAGTEGAVPLTPAQKREVTEALQRIAVAEAGHALALTGLEGYERRPLMEHNALLHELHAASPDAHAEYVRRMFSARVLPFSVIEKNWPDLREQARSTRVRSLLPFLMQRERADALRAER